MMLRIEPGKGRKDRYAMLSPVLLELLRDWWRIARPKAWLFPGRDPLLPMSTRQLNRACHAAADMAEITKRVAAQPVTALRATCSMPVLCLRISDPVAQRFVLSFAHPDKVVAFAQTLTNLRVSAQQGGIHENFDRWFRACLNGEKTKVVLRQLVDYKIGAQSFIRHVGG